MTGPKIATCALFGLGLIPGCAEDRVLASRAALECGDEKQLTLASDVTSELEELAPWDGDYAAFYISQRTMVVARLAVDGSLVDGPFEIGHGPDFDGLKVVRRPGGFDVAFMKRVDGMATVRTGRLEDDGLSEGIVDVQITLPSETGTDNPFLSAYKGRTWLALKELRRFAVSPLEEGLASTVGWVDSAANPIQPVGLHSHADRFWLIVQGDGTTQVEVFSPDPSHEYTGWSDALEGPISFDTTARPLMARQEDDVVRVWEMSSDGTAPLASIASYPEGATVTGIDLVQDSEGRATVGWTTDSGMAKVAFVGGDDAPRTLAQDGADADISLVATPVGALVALKMELPESVVVHGLCR